MSEDSGPACDGGAAFCSRRDYMKPNGQCVRDQVLATERGVSPCPDSGTTCHVAFIPR